VNDRIGSTLNDRNPIILASVMIGDMPRRRPSRCTAMIARRVLLRRGFADTVRIYPEVVIVGGHRRKGRVLLSAHDDGTIVSISREQHLSISPHER